MHEIRCGPIGVPFKTLPDPSDERHEDVFGLEKPGVPDDDHFASGEEGGGDEGFAETVDIFVFAVRHEEVELPVPGLGDEGRRYFFEGVMEEKLLITAEEVTGRALPPLQFRKDRLKRGYSPLIVVLKRHLPFALTASF